MKSDKKLIGAGLVSAIAASLCCLTPVLALLAGTGGVSSTLSWFEPFRPYFIGLTVFVLGVAWFQKLKPQKQTDCICESDEKNKFIHSKAFLGLVTVFSIVLLAFPYYSSVFYPDSKREVIVFDRSNIQTTEFKIKGMTCASCEEHVKHEVNKLNGIVSSQISYENGNAIIEFDQTKTKELEIEKSINSTGYKVIDKNKK